MSSPIDPDRLDADASDEAAGWVLLLLTLLMMIGILGVLVWLGWQRAPLLGWPALITVLYFGLRLWKQALGSTVEDVEAVVDHSGNVFDQTTPAEALHSMDTARSERRLSIADGTAVLLVLLHAVFIVLVWYGIGRGVRALVELF